MCFHRDGHQLLCYNVTRDSIIFIMLAWRDSTRKVLKEGQGTVSNAHEVDGNNGAVCGTGTASLNIKQGQVLYIMHQMNCSHGRTARGA
jgi:hypothetical protein